MLTGIFIIALKSLGHRKLRTFLTVLGVVIGVAAIIGMVSATNAISNSITKQIEKFQTNVIEVVPGQFKLGFSVFPSQVMRNTLTEKDAKIIESIAGVEAVSSSVHSSGIISKGKEKFSLTILGIDENFEKINTIGILKGRYPKNPKEVLIGYSVAYDLFDKPIALKEKIYIDGKSFRVIGIMNKAGGIFKSVDSMVYIPKQTLREMKNLDKESVNAIDVKVEENADPEEVAEEIEYRLAKAHHVSLDEKDFTVFSPKFSKEIASQITSMLQILLGSIAGISFLVGAIGIANMMFTSVLERIREIGILKAIGATDRQVMLIFLIEAGLIGIIGGVIGIFLGYGLGEGFLLLRQYMLTHSGLVETAFSIPKIEIDIKLSLAALLMSFIIGIAAGIIPARKAAKLEPVEALRYE